MAKVVEIKEAVKGSKNYIDRMEDECRELKEKITKADHAMKNPPKDMTESERGFLFMQIIAMREYCSILEARIELAHYKQNK